MDLKNIEGKKQLSSQKKTESLTKKDLSAFQEIAHSMKEKFYTWIDGLNKEVLFP